MSLIDMIEQGAGSGALQQIGARVGLSPDEMQSVIGSLAPMLGPKLAQHAASGGLDNASADDAPVPGSDEAEDHGKSILGEILESKDASRSAAAAASANIGISVDKIKAVLPQLASIAAAALVARKVSSGGGFGGLGGLLGGLGKA
ncbi:DUF937 domain-containing protein [Sphingomonas nostoxanthinifaciens]|uniref:DUF937 domain-containing protein n=1 Tax=Sphingomonas nostoxanthinifaciens TaxID=2872652 RepID=UPI001CC1C81E|nr:DUF937 domain-containing protein [Sphingomonas nostoxanthinifaciens]UAK25497.1 DUF937 domain-containing protein [Sphingomonas nostoxanthinifaciens]